MEDLQIDDLTFNLSKNKKKVNGKKKGNRVELELCKMLTSHFDADFSRSLGSGNRWSQVNNMPAHAKKTLTGDICPPENFKWVIECKGGYDNDVDFSSVLDGGCARIDEFIEQSSKDAEQSNQKPIICWKRSRKPWIVILKQSDLDPKFKADYCLNYRQWIICSLDHLLSETNRNFWFDM